MTASTQNSLCEEDAKQLFWRVIHDQSRFGGCPKVRAMELLLGNYPFDDQLVNDGVPKSIVGPLVMENGAKYYGHWNATSNERHGFGMQIWADGSKYVGYWEHDKANGNGRLIHSDGDVYTGEFKNNAAFGHGKYVNCAGMEYLGEWVDDQQCGTGTHFLAEKSRDRTQTRGDCIRGGVQGGEEEREGKVHLDRRVVL